MLVLKKATLLLLILASMMASMGCTIGVKAERETVFVSPVPIPEAAKGAVMVATNRKIPLAIIGREDFRFTQNVGGYVLVDPWFYDLLLKAYKEKRDGVR